MSESFDAVVIGAGPGGRGVAKRLVGAGLSVAMVEAELVGGECPFWACIPTKALLRPVEAVGEAGHVAGIEARVADLDAVLEYRDYMNSGLEDDAKAKAFADRGIEIVRGRARIDGPGRVRVGGRELTTERTVIATGTTATVPLIDGLADADPWTNREATAMPAVPESAVVLGGGPVGIELGQMLARFGARTTIVEAGERLLAREDPEVSALLADVLGEDGIDLRIGSAAERVERSADGVTVTLDSGDEVHAERVVVAVGRTPRTDDIGLETVGIEPGEQGIEIDERCRAADGVWAVGDVTGIAMFTHLAAYQSRIVAADILGDPRPADYRAIPRVVFCDPEVAGVGLTRAQADEQGLRTESTTVDLAQADRTETYGRDLVGTFGVVADTEREVLVGAWAVGPLASEWIHQPALAIKAQVPLAVLRDSVSQFPTFSELMLTAVEQLGA